jgi:type 1 glutamine amidotransferase
MFKTQGPAALGAILFCTASAWAADPSYKALIVDGQNNHSWKDTTPVLKKILEDTNLFTVDVATAPPGKDLSDFRPNFADYKLVVSNYNGEEWSDETKKAFAAYVKNGGGFVSVHAADNSFPKWPEYNEIIGLGGWGNRDEKSGPYVRVKDGKVVQDDAKGRGGSHGAQHQFLVETLDKEHPITKGLPDKWLHAADELYDRLRGPAKNLTVLAYSYADPKKGGSGENEPILFTVSYGKGRVFHTVMGHGVAQMKCVGFIVTLQRGAEWAATGEVTQKVPDDFPTADKSRSRP